MFERNKIDDFNYSEFATNKTKPTRIAIAISGGGYRSMLIGAGVLEAYDNRTPESENHLGGLLQSVSYIAGISGGSWLVMSNLVNNFVPIHILKQDSNSWDLQRQLLEGIPNFEQPSLEGEINENPYLSSNSQDKYHLSTSSEENLEEYRSKDLDNDINSRIEDKVRYLKHSNEKPKPLLLRIVYSMFSRDKNSSKALENPDRTSWRSIFNYYQELHIEVRSKRAAGFYLSFTDYWGRALSRKIFRMAARAPGATITGCTELSTFKLHYQPFPIICTIEKAPNYISSKDDSHIFEFTPFEFGSWDSYLEAFVPVKYLGSSLFDGKSTVKVNNTNNSICISGFDNIGFITGTSSSLFNHVFLYIYNKLLNMKLDFSIAIQTILKAFGLSSSFTSIKFPQLHPDYALYSPNPFYGYKRASGEIKNSKHIYLVDGGDDGQNIPFQPFLVDSRDVDIIISFDMTADIQNYPNGTTINNSYRRFSKKSMNLTNPHFHLPLPYKEVGGKREISDKLIQIKASFPKVPTPQIVFNENLNKRPVFLGCDLFEDYEVLDIKKESDISKHSAKANYLPPLIVYNANTEHSYSSNTSTFKLSYSKNEMLEMIRNGYNIATFLNSTTYYVCLNCAILKREFDRILLGMNDRIDPLSFTIPEVCEECYEDFCWTIKKNGKLQYQ